MAYGFLRWAEAIQRHHGDNAQVIKEFKHHLRKAPPEQRKDPKELLRFAKVQDKLIREPY